MPGSEFELPAELVLIAIAFGGAALTFSQTRELFLGVSSWRMEPVAEGGELTSADLNVTINQVQPVTIDQFLAQGCLFGF